MVHGLGSGFRADPMPSLVSEGLSGMKEKCVGYVWGPDLWDFSPLPTGRSNLGFNTYLTSCLIMIITSNYLQLLHIIFSLGSFPLYCSSFYF